jgi:hypothetical protein
VKKEDSLLISLSGFRKIRARVMRVQTRSATRFAY